MVAAAWVLFRGLQRGRERSPFFASLALFVLCFVGLLISLSLPRADVGHALGGRRTRQTSLGFLLKGAAVLVPVILAYTAYSYWVFRGKVDPAGGYH